MAGCRGAGVPGQPHPGLPPGTTPGLWRGGGCSARPIPTPPWGGSPVHTLLRADPDTGPHPAPPPRRPCAPFLGIFESDDISAIASEMEKALNYSEKVRHAFRGAGRAAPCGSWGCRPVPSSEGPGRNPFPASSGGRVKETRIAPDACEKRGARLYARLLQREGARPQPQQQRRGGSEPMRRVAGPWVGYCRERPRSLSRTGESLPRGPNGNRAEGRPRT